MSPYYIEFTEIGLQTNCRTGKSETYVPFRLATSTCSPISMRVPGARWIPLPIMLFKFTTPDMLNTSLIDVVTGNLSYGIATVAVPVDEVQQCESIKEESICLAPSVVAFQPPCNGPSSSKSSLTTKACSVAVVKQSHWEESGTSPSEARRTTIKDPTGTVVADIVWNGRRPSITICDEKVGGLTDLFGSTTVRFMYVHILLLVAIL